MLNLNNPKDLHALHSKICSTIGEITDFEFANYVEYVLTSGILAKKNKKDEKSL